MAAQYRAPEPDILKPLLARAALTPDSRQRVMGHASGLLAEPMRRDCAQLTEVVVKYERQK